MLQSLRICYLTQTPAFYRLSFTLGTPLEKGARYKTFSEIASQTPKGAMFLPLWCCFPALLQRSQAAGHDGHLARFGGSFEPGVLTCAHVKALVPSSCVRTALVPGDVTNGNLATLKK